MSDPYATDPWAVDVPAEDSAPESPPADPWATEQPSDEAQTNTPAPAPKETVNVTNVNSSEPKITTTIKYGQGFDAPWTVFHSASVEEAKVTLDSAKELLELTAKVAKFAKTLDSGTAAPAARGNGAQRPSSSPPGVPTKDCAHGEMKYVTGTSAKGPWKAYFCPLEKGDPEACKVVWVK